MEQYSPGLHILASFKAPADLLQDAGRCRQLFDALIERFELEKVGETYHSFPGTGFTSVVCLTESHLSIHTWPEFGHATFDVFLSNFRRDNSDKVHAIYQAVLAGFEAEEMNRQEIQR